MLNAGDRAPDFSLESDEGKTVSLAELRGKTVVLYFYPKDDTPGCTREANDFSAAADAFAAAGAVVLGVSRDSVARHCKFRDKYALRVKLLSDPDLVAHEAYGTYGEKSMYGKKVTGTIRSTFVIGPDGVVKHAIRGVKVDGHAGAVLALVRGASAPEPSPSKIAEKPSAKQAPARSAKRAPATPEKTASSTPAKRAPSTAAKKAPSTPAKRAPSAAAKKSPAVPARTR